VAIAAFFVGPALIALVLLADGRERRRIARSMLEWDRCNQAVARACTGSQRHAVRARASSKGTP
jgi:hypothetical protein